MPSYAYELKEDERWAVIHYLRAAARPGTPVRRTSHEIAALGVLGSPASRPRISRGAGTRFWVNWIVWMLFLASVGLGALFLIALEHLFIARWSVPLRRTAERSRGWSSGRARLPSPPSGPCASSTPGPSGGAPPLLVAVTVWLNIPFFCVRTLLCAGIWVFSYRFFIGGSIAQDESHDPAANLRARRFAPVFMALFALTVTVAAFDWMSSLQPEWYSDIFGVYLFAGVFLAGLAGVTASALHLQDRGRLPGVRSDHLYNLGALMFAFTVFWSYIAFSQYMLIWYGNLPRRSSGTRAASRAADAGHLPGLLRFVVPARCRPRAKRTVACFGWPGWPSPTGSTYWLVYPELGIGRALANSASSDVRLRRPGLIRREMTFGEDMPVGDPFLKEGLEFRL